MNKMKIAIIGSILMLLLSFGITLSNAAEPELGGGRISLVQGQVLIQIKDEGEWTEASVNFPVADGDRIMTERDGRVELNFKNGTYVRIGEISLLDIIALGFDRGKPFIHLNQLEGRIYVNHRPINEEASSLYIDLPYGVLSSYVPSRFRIDLTSSEARISVLEGSVEFKRDGRPIPLTQGKTLIAKEGGYAEVVQLYGRDEWDRWNEARDNELLQRRYAQKYLPPELEPYGYELEGNGRWFYTPEYQYVWVPTVVVGWAPFQYGSWAWRRGVYCWVPREPWGWVPFHYGRWVHLRNHGWAWVPPVRHATIWNPGAVAWNIGPSHVSWVPLAPGEIYYGNRYYGPQSVNINQANISIQNNVYINAQVKDAVVTIQKDSFFKRNPVKITQVKNPFLKAVKVSVPPIEKPVLVGEKKTPSRLIKESVGKVQPEKKPSSKDWGKDIPSVQKGPKMIEEKRVTGSPEKKMVSETTQNRVEGTVRSNRQINSSQGNSVKKDLSPVTIGEKVKREDKVLNSEGDKNRNVPVVPPVTVKTVNAKEPKYSQAVPERNASRTMNQDRSGRIEQSNSNKGNLGQRDLISLPLNDGTRVKSPNPVAQSPQRNVSVNIYQNRSERTAQSNTFQGNVGGNQSSPPMSERTKVESPNPVTQSPQRNASVNVNQNRIERAGQSNFSQSLPTRQEGKAFAGRSSLPEVRSFSSTVPASKGQMIQNNRGSVGGFLGVSPMRSFR